MRFLGNYIRLTVNNLTISYSDQGPDNTPVIIFIHGFPFNKSMWDKQVDALKDNYRVIAYDVRGHGQSDEGKEDFSIDSFVNDLVGLIDALKIDKVVLCGLSMGGYIALNAVEKHPKRFEALVLSDTQCIADAPEVKENRLNTIESIKKTGVADFAYESIKKLFAPESFSTKKKEIAAVREMIMNTSKHSLCNTLNALAERKETCSHLHKINMPVLIMVGKEDKITTLAAARFMHENIKDSYLAILEQSGHVANMENPEEFNIQLKLFLRRLEKKSRFPLILKPAKKS